MQPCEKNPKKPSSRRRRRIEFSCLVGERELGCIGIWISWEYYCALLYLPNFIVKFLCRLRGGRQFAEPRKFLCSIVCACYLISVYLLLLIWVLGCYLHNTNRSVSLFPPTTKVTNKPHHKTRRIKACM